MVKFAWSWADYEREKRKEERKTARAAKSESSIFAPLPQYRVGEVFAATMQAKRDKAASVDTSPDPVVTTAEPVDDEDCEDLSLEAQLQHCGACGKKRLQRCEYGGCPLL